MNTLEGNRLIAEFMGNNGHHPANGIIFGCTNQSSCCGGDSPDCGGREKLIKYDSSWDWLMPVVEKIENIVFYPKDIPTLLTKFRFLIHTNIVGIEGIAAGYPSNIKHVDNSKIDCVWKCVIDFIEWYNKNK